MSNRRKQDTALSLDALPPDPDSSEDESADDIARAPSDIESPSSLCAPRVHHSRKRRFSLAFLLLCAAWALGLVYGELLRIHFAVRSCGYERADGAVSRLVMVGDPQLIDSPSYGYATRFELLGRAAAAVADAYVRRAWSSADSVLAPDAFVVLGDVLDAGRALSDASFAASAARTKRVMRRANGGRVHVICGNHDIGWRIDGVERNARRFSKAFGALHWIEPIAGDASALVGVCVPLLAEPSGSAREEAEAFLEVASSYQAVRTKVLLSHIPLWRPPGTPCGAGSVNGPITAYQGYSYTNMLPKSISQRILDAVQPTYVFSGDSHDWCQVNHTYGKVKATEYTLPAFSMTGGQGNPGMALVTVHRDGRLYVAHCNLPNHYYTFGAYAVAAVASILLLSKAPQQPAHTRYFIIKSFSERDVEVSKEKGIWATQPHNEQRLNDAFTSASEVVLFFSVNGSGKFQGAAKMTSPASGDSNPTEWDSSNGNSPVRWGSIFSVTWLCKNELPFGATAHLKNPLNMYKPVKVSRDGQEVTPEIGSELFALMTGAKQPPSPSQFACLPAPPRMAYAQQEMQENQNRPQRYTLLRQLAPLTRRSIGLDGVAQVPLMYVNAYGQVIPDLGTYNPVLLQQGVIPFFPPQQSSPGAQFGSRSNPSSPKSSSPAAQTDAQSSKPPASPSASPTAEALCLFCGRCAASVAAYPCMHIVSCEGCSQHIAVAGCPFPGCKEEQQQRVFQLQQAYQHASMQMPVGPRRGSPVNARRTGAPRQVLSYTYDAGGVLQQQRDPQQV
eukprot:m51a1_g94 putative potential mn2+ homeostasis protein (787) ;mRNA; f:293075-296816